MTRTVFLDVGAHHGQSLGAVLDLDFDWIVCFEPVPDCWPRLRNLASPKVHIEQFGLWDKDASKVTVYDPGTKGAGLWVKEKRQISLNGQKPPEIQCEFRQASKWFKENLLPGDRVFLKLNCEGAEVDIIDDLLDSGEFEKVDYAMVDFDSRKILSMRHREEMTRKRLAQYPFPRVAYCKDVMKGETHHKRIRNWLRLTEAVPKLNDRRPPR